MSSILVYSRTVGYRHDSIPTAIEAIRSFGYNSTFTEDPSYFANSSSLAQYQALVFLSNSDEILDSAQKENLEQYLLDGGGLVGIHSATASLFNTPFYGTAFGAFFDRHPQLQNATFEVANASHPSTSQLPQRWNYVEEVYNFKSDPRDTNVTLLLTVDPDSYEDSGKVGSEALQGSPHPIAWYRDRAIDLGNGTNTNGMNSTNGTDVQQGSFVASGRMWYTSLGHTIDIWQDPTFHTHIKGGIDWVLEQANTAPVNETTGGSSTGVAPAAGSNGSSNTPHNGASARTSRGATLVMTSLLAMSLFLVLLG